ncbi:protein LEG1 homolog [Lampris incognitus]|uniref:protein LEG1 homolog n=1 Tax=Lampris incognitus TaxID=2546036 RepID=UPI0024B5AA0A|nr:protein LEG1 homolog [Lampris incognitus]
MLRPLALSVLFAGMVSFTNSAVLVENGLPIFWQQSASQLTDLPTENGVLTPNPWHFRDRLSLYRMITTATDPYLSAMGMATTDSPVWGLPLTLGWELNSGRLADPTGTTTCGLQTGDAMCISTQSWWACANYLISVLPFLSAAQQGLFGEELQVKMQAPAGEGDYCTTYADCAARFPDPMAKWDVFYQSLKATLECVLPDDEKQVQLHGRYWAAHQASMRASAACDSRHRYYSSTEVSFTKSLLNAVEYVAAAYFHSNIDRSLMFLNPLPGRVLQENDKAPNIADLSREENHTLSILSWINYADNSLGDRLLRLWRRAMCSVSTREKGRALLEQILLKQGFVSTALSLSMVTEMTTKC